MRSILLVRIASIPISRGRKEEASLFAEDIKYLHLGQKTSDDNQRR